MAFRWQKVVISAAALPFIAACAAESTLPQGTLVPTGIKIDPVDFLSGVECAPRPGGMQSYVATLIDVSDPANPFTLPSSPPTPCAVPSDFRFLVVDDFYVAEIDGYSQPASELTPINSVSSGSRHMLLDANPVVPRWNGDCGAGAGNEAQASDNFDVQLRHCSPLRDLEGSVATGLEVDPTSTLGQHFQCTDAGGAVAYFTIKSDDKTLGTQMPKECTTDLLPIWIYDVGVKPGREYHFEVAAHDDDKRTIGTSSCYAASTDGLVVLAICTELNP